MKNIVLVFLVLGVCSQAGAEIGVTDTEIIIGAHTNESGPIASAGAPAPLAGAAYFDMINKNGGINGRKIKWIRKDSQSLAPKTVDGIRQLVEEDKVFAIVGANGPSHLAVVKYLNEKKIPDLFFSDGSTTYDNPEYKMSFPFYYSWESEGQTVAQWVAKNKKGKKACLLLTKDALGDEYEKGAKSALEAYNSKASDSDKIKIGVALRVDRTGTQADSEVLNFKQEKCDVIMSSVYGPMIPSAVNYGLAQGYKPTWFIQSYNVSAKFISLLNEGGAEGIMSVANLAREKSMAKNKKGWDKFEDLMNKNHIAVSGTAAVGYTLAEAFVETLKRTGKDVTRENILKTAEGLDDWSCSLCLAPLKTSPTNHRPFGPPRLVAIKKGQWHFID